MPIYITVFTNRDGERMPMTYFSALCKTSGYDSDEVERLANELGWQYTPTPLADVETLVSFCELGAKAKEAFRHSKESK